MPGSGQEEVVSCKWGMWVFNTKVRLKPTKLHSTEEFLGCPTETNHVLFKDCYRIIPYCTVLKTP